MFVDFTENKIEKTITNDNYLFKNERVEIANHDGCAYPNRKYYYNVEISNLTEAFYINNGHSVTGVFENINFTSRTFFDCSTFKNVIFKNCHFDNIDIRWCKFINCHFINCSGEIKYIRASTLKRGCKFEDTCIEVQYIDEYMFLNSKRYNGYNYNIKIQ